MFNKFFKENADTSSTGVDIDVATRILKDDCKLDFIDAVGRFAALRIYIHEVPTVSFLHTKMGVLEVCFTPALFEIVKEAKKPVPDDLDEQDKQLITLRDLVNLFAQRVGALKADALEHGLDAQERLDKHAVNVVALHTSVKRSVLAQRTSRLAKCITTTKEIYETEKLLAFMRLVTAADLQLKTLEEKFEVTDLFEEDGPATKFMFAFWETEAMEKAVSALGKELGENHEDSVVVASLLRFKTEFAALAASQMIARPLDEGETRASLIYCLVHEALDAESIQLLPPAIHGFITAIDPKVDALKEPVESIAHSPLPIDSLIAHSPLPIDSL